MIRNHYPIVQERPLTLEQELLATKQKQISASRARLMLLSLGRIQNDTIIKPGLLDVFKHVRIGEDTMNGDSSE